MPVHPSYCHLDTRYFAEMVSFWLKRGIEIHLHAGGRVHVDQTDPKVASMASDGCGRVTITTEQGEEVLSANVPEWLVNALSEWREAERHGRTTLVDENGKLMPPASIAQRVAVLANLLDTLAAADLYEMETAIAQWLVGKDSAVVAALSTRGTIISMAE